MNYLLPHIRRMPEKLARDQFAVDAAQKLGIDSAVLREELARPPPRRSAGIRATAADPVNRNEKRLLRALLLPAEHRTRLDAAASLAVHPEWTDGPRRRVARATRAGTARLRGSKPSHRRAHEAGRQLLAGVLFATGSDAEPSPSRSQTASTASNAATSNAASAKFAPSLPRPNAKATPPCCASLWTKKLKSNVG